MTESNNKRDALGAFDELSINLKNARGIVHAVSLAAFHDAESDGNTLHYALEAAYDLLDEAKDAADDLLEAADKAGDVDVVP